MSVATAEKLGHLIRWAAEDEADDSGTDPMVSLGAKATFISLLEPLGDLGALPCGWPHVDITDGGGLSAEWRGLERDVLLRVRPSVTAPRLIRVTVPPKAPVTTEGITSPTTEDLRAALDWLDRRQ